MKEEESKNGDKQMIMNLEEQKNDLRNNEAEGALSRIEMNRYMILIFMSKTCLYLLT